MSLCEECRFNEAQPGERICWSCRNSVVQTKPAWEDAFDEWWPIHRINDDYKTFARWVWSAAWNAKEVKP